MAAPKTVPVNLRMPPEDARRLDELARILERNRSETLRLLIRRAHAEEARVTFSRDDTERTK